MYFNPGNLRDCSLPYLERQAKDSIRVDVVDGRIAFEQVMEAEVV
ncbi:MAG: hypothetical protein AB1899_16100 [Pseudomonadota bacterium]